MPRHILALNVDLSAATADGKAPAWVELIPAGPTITGRDGRTWLFDEEAQTSVLAIFAARGVDLAIDINHALQLQAPDGKESPAAGWVDQLEVRNAALWGHVNWTPRGDVAVTSRDYRYLSPVFDYEPDNGRILRLVSSALTNTPNLRLTALNHEEPTVALSAAIAAALGLKADATDEAAVAAVNALKTAQAANSEANNLERYVPRADYDALQTRATNAEQALATKTKTEHETAVNAEIDAALKAGKITPATETYHRASCSDAAGLERFREFVKAAAVVGDPSHLDGKTPPNTTTALNTEMAAIGKLFGLDADDFKKYGEGA